MARQKKYNWKGWFKVRKFELNCVIENLELELKYQDLEPQEEKEVREELEKARKELEAL
mgnify:CR=1 FL=1